MKSAGFKGDLLIRAALSVAAGFFLALSFPKAGLAGLAWVAPGLLLMAALGCGGSAAFRFGYVGGAVHYLASLHWLLFIPFPAGAVAGWLALSAYLALYPATWVWLCWRLFPGKFQTSALDANAEDYASRSTLHASRFTWPRPLLDQFVSTPLFQRALWALACATIWVALETAVARLLTGFPWNLLGVSQVRILPVTQIASVTGVYGVSFLIAWFSVALACAGLVLMARPASARLWLGDLLFPVLGVGFVCWFGVQQITATRPSAQTVRMALVQPSIPQTLIWDPKENTNRFNQLLRLTERALQEKPAILVWPEAAVPNVLRYEPDAYAEVRKLAMDHRVWMILGADDAVPRTEPSTGREFDYFNSSFLINPEGKIVATYRKRRLVIFGEYVPLVRWLPFLKHFTPITEGFRAGEAITPFWLTDLKVKTSALICFEDAFPHSVREYAEPDVDFLLNLTNNGWFGESAAQWQHAANAALRAVENGLPLVRCANNGLSCWVDPRGGMHEVFFPDSNDIYGAGFKIVEIPVRRGGEKRERTFYNRHGDWFGWGCVGIVLGLLAFSLASAKSRSTTNRE
ncbi:MAG: apolipoprotein N-acyltransferase [Verrucomicrobia bacterium]|nr:apolipoprotein N-acyltransferase [Verrucomicrobiota bacterium]